MPKADFDMLRGMIEATRGYLIEQCTTNYCIPYDVDGEPSSAVEDIEHLALHKIDEMLESCLCGIASMHRVCGEVDALSFEPTEAEISWLFGGGEDRPPEGTRFRALWDAYGGDKIMEDLLRRGNANLN